MKGRRATSLLPILLCLSLTEHCVAIKGRRRLRLRQEGLNYPHSKSLDKHSEDDNGILREWASQYHGEGTSMAPSPAPTRPRSPRPTIGVPPTGLPTPQLQTNRPSAVPVPTMIPSITKFPTSGAPIQTILPTAAPSIVSPKPSPMLPTDLPSPAIPPITLIPIVVPTESPTRVPSSKQTVLDIISETAAYQTFETVVTTAGLENLLGNQNASLTVFAPTNTAFDTIEPSYLESLLTPPYHLQLVSLATFHVLAGAVLPSSALSNGLVLTMLNRENIEISRNAPGVFPEIQLLTSSVEAGRTPIINVTEKVDQLGVNGVVHEIDSVLFPPWYFFNATDLIPSVPSIFQLLRAIINAVGYELGASPVTFFTPNDSALARLPEETRAFLQLPENFDIVRQILEYHTVDALIPFTELPQGASSIQTRLGEVVTITNGGNATATLTNVAVNSIPIENVSIGRTAILYEISRVLIPPSLASELPGYRKR